MRRILTAALLLLVATTSVAQNRSDDEYTRYELLAPETSSFKIIYDVTAVTPGAKFFFNPIRRGSVASDESVIDVMSGQPLEFKDVGGGEARESGLPNADLEGRYIRVTLARAVPAGGKHASASSRLTRIRRAITATARPSSSTGRSASNAMRSCCHRSTS